MSFSQCGSQAPGMASWYSPSWFPSHTGPESFCVISKMCRSDGISLLELGNRRQPSVLDALGHANAFSLYIYFFLWRKPAVTSGGHSNGLIERSIWEKSEGLSPRAHEELRPVNNHETDLSTPVKPSDAITAAVNILSAALLDTPSDNHLAKLPLGSCPSETMT